MPNQIAFVHLIGPDGLITQLDAPPGGAYWFPHWWQEDQLVHEQRILTLPAPLSFDPDSQVIRLGLYDPETLDRLPITVDGAALSDDSLLLVP